MNQLKMRASHSPLIKHVNAQFNNTALLNVTYSSERESCLSKSTDLLSKYY